MGHIIGLAVSIAVGAGAALAEGRDTRFDAGADVQQPGAERPEQTFVSRRGEQVDVELLDVEGYLADGLRRVQ